MQQSPYSQWANFAGNQPFSVFFVYYDTLQYNTIHYTKVQSISKYWFNFRIDLIKRRLFKSWLKMLGMVQKNFIKATFHACWTYLALINRAGGLYGRILTEVVNTGWMQWGLHTWPRSRFSHTDRLGSVNKMFIIWQRRNLKFV